MESVGPFVSYIPLEGGNVYVSLASIYQFKPLLVTLQLLGSSDSLNSVKAVMV